MNFHQVLQDTACLVSTTDSLSQRTILMKLLYYDITICFLTYSFSQLFNVCFNRWEHLYFTCYCDAFFLLIVFIYATPANQLLICAATCIQSSGVHFLMTVEKDIFSSRTNLSSKRSLITIVLLQPSTLQELHRNRHTIPGLKSMKDGGWKRQQQALFISS